MHPRPCKGVGRVKVLTIEELTSDHCRTVRDWAILIGDKELARTANSAMGNPRIMYKLEARRHVLSLVNELRATIAATAKEPS